MIESDKKAAEEYADKYDAIVNDQGDTNYEDLREGFLAGCAHKEREMRSGKPDGWCIAVEDNIDPDSFTLSEKTHEAELQAVRKEFPSRNFRSVPVKLIELTEEEQSK